MQTNQTTITETETSKAIATVTSYTVDYKVDEVTVNSLVLSMGKGEWQFIQKFKPAK